MAAFGSLASEAAIYTKEFTGDLELSVLQSATTALIFVVAGTAATTILLRTRDLT
jgi:hypothetical protein